MFQRFFSLTICLFVFWLILSGIYKPYLVISGAIISIFITVFMFRAEIIDHESHPINHFFKIIFFYWPWLIKEIFFSALNVTKLILTKKKFDQSGMDWIEVKNLSELGVSIYANSITLTPGTISVETKKDKILVHYLEQNGYKDLLSGRMNKKVKNTGVS